MNYVSLLLRWNRSSMLMTTFWYYQMLNTNKNDSSISKGLSPPTAVKLTSLSMIIDSGVKYERSTRNIFQKQLSKIFDRQLTSKPFSQQQVFSVMSMWKKMVAHDAVRRGSDMISLTFMSNATCTGIVKKKNKEQKQYKKSQNSFLSL